jgi:hypothetical protein
VHRPVAENSLSAPGASQLAYSHRVSRRRTSSSFGSIKQVGVATSIGFPLLVIGFLTLLVLLVSLVGTGTLLWILAAAVAALGLLAAASRWVL